MKISLSEVIKWDWMELLLCDTDVQPVSES